MSVATVDVALVACDVCVMVITDSSQLYLLPLVGTSFVVRQLVTSGLDRELVFRLLSFRMCQPHGPLHSPDGVCNER